MKLIYTITIFISILTIGTGITFSLYNNSYSALTSQIDVKSFQPQKLNLLEKTTTDCYTGICQDYSSSSSSSSWGGSGSFGGK